MLRSFNDVITVNTMLFAYILYVARDGILFNVVEVSFLEFITAEVRGAIHEQSMIKLNKTPRKHSNISFFSVNLGFLLRIHSFVEQNVWEISWL